MKTETRLCPSCGKAIKGRLDKKFCDDYCRNSYNNQLNSDQNNLVRNINNILRKNRRVLEKMIPAGEDMKKVSQEQLVSEGFNFKFHTHQYQNRKGQVYYFSYEYGYLPLEDDRILVVRRKSRNEVGNPGQDRNT